MSSDDNVGFWIVIVGMIFLIVVAAFGIIIHINISPGIGEQIGYIAEVEKSGLLWQPVNIVLIGSEATFSESQTSWNYASASQEVTDIARKFLKSHEKAIVKYETSTWVFSWDYSSAVKIVNISPAEIK